MAVEIVGGGGFYLVWSKNKGSRASGSVDIICLGGADCEDSMVMVDVDIGEREYSILFLDACVPVAVVSGCVVHW